MHNGQTGTGPSHHARTQSPLLPQGLGPRPPLPPDKQRWLTVPIAQRGQVRPGRSIHSDAHGGREGSASLILPAPHSNQGWRVPLPPRASAFPSCFGWEAGVAFRGKSGRALVSQRVAVQLSPASPAPPLSLGSCGGERGAGRNGVDTHRPKLPVWASCRMRCSCLFIILGVSWQLRGHGGGRGPAAPSPASLCPLRSRWG